MDIKSSKDFVSFLGDTMEGVRKGDIGPAAGNAIANLSGKIIQMVVLEMKAVTFPKLTDRKALRIEAAIKK